MKYIIEHLDGTVYKWCQMEYKHISETVGRDNLIFTNVKGDAGKKILEKLGEVKTESVIKLNLKNACILDPVAKDTIKTADCKKYDYLIFGGILGDYPMRARTKSDLSDKMPDAELKNIGQEQMSTNTAVYVVHEISKGKTMDDFDFQDDLVIPTGENEEVILPFRYVKINGKLMIPEGLIEHIKTQEF